MVRDSSFNFAHATVLLDPYCFHACPESSIGLVVMVHFPLHSSLISLLVEPRFQWLTNGVGFGLSLMGERGDHSRVAIWTECQRMDMLLTESRIFLCRRDTESIIASLTARAQKLTGNMSCFVPRSPHSLQQRGVCNLETRIF